MNFYSMQFVIFLVITYICYYTVFRKKQWICLLVASMVFYYWTGIENFVFLLLTGITIWAGARYIDRYFDKLQELRKDKTIEKEEKNRQKAYILKKRRIMMWSVLLINFGVLAIVKYLEPVFKLLGFVSQEHSLGIILPLGISFYTFQSIGYLLDVYNSKYHAEKNFGRYLTFVSFFPQLVQGPINRYDSLREQLFTKHKIEIEQAKRAILQIAFGTLKKYAIANVTAEMVSLLLDKPERNYPGCMIVFGILLYSLQQYADFSGGIDMVLGIAKLFGINMIPNFRQPYFATSLADFWRRWHISLGKWMRDYVFYPFALTKPIKKLGKWANEKLGKHTGRMLPAALGNIVVFFLVGLWHGAQWNYIFWGLYNGIVIAVSDFISPLYGWLNEKLRINTESKIFRLFQIVRTFIIVNIGWYFDRVESLENCLQYMRNTLFDFGLDSFRELRAIVFINIAPRAYVIVALASLLVLVNSILCEQKKDVYELLHRRNIVVRWAIYLLMLILIWMSFTCSSVAGGFMYANF